MKHVVPLNALRAFEAAARSGSFTNAARELAVTPAAVSQQVKLLEDFWGTTLFIRQGNRIALTDSGRTAYPQLAQSLATLNDLSDKMRRTEQARRLVLSIPQSIAETWLAQRLAGLDGLEAGTPLEIRVEDDPIDFTRNRVSVRIFYGHDLYREHRVEDLFSDELVGVASSAFVADHGATLEGLEDRYLIHTDWGRDYATSPDWGAVVAGGRVVDRGRGMRVQTSSVALSFACQGFGAALLPRRMAERDLATGAVVALEMSPIPMPYAYKIAYPDRLAKNAVIRSFVRALSS